MIWTRNERPGSASHLAGMRTASSGHQLADAATVALTKRVAFVGNGADI
jgi:hypothetical protein